MSGIQEKAVASLPSGILRIVFQKLGVEDIDKVCTTHRSARVTTLSFLNHGCSQYADIVGCAV